MSTSAKTNLLAPSPRPDAAMVRGKGSFLWDENGSRYLDFVQGWAVNVLGHAPAVIRDALARQSATLINPSPAYHNRPHLDFAARLCKAAHMERVFFCNSGAEANEGAIKLARKWGRTHRGGACEIVTFTGAFHGRTLATMAATDKPGWDTLFGPVSPGFRRVPFGDLDATADAIGDRTVAVMLEPIQGEAGVVVPPAGFLSALRKLTCERGVLLICDEIQTGMGRTGPLLAHQHENVTPDILTLGKGIGGGVPLAAVLARETVACFEPGDQGGTFNGNPLMMAVGQAVLDAITARNFVEHAAGVSRTMFAGLHTLAAEFEGVGLRGTGHLLALTLPAANAAAIAARCFEAGLLLNAPQPHVLRLMPALTTTRAEVETMLGLLSPIMAEQLA
ncbi:MAG: aminotransferase class III-fold pyridoxal phosphate-dependent enzyme [bacterium]|nr:aminotransferase class III-fold pyridoxal phosphate-dependent enzyme [bacterium]